MRRERVRAVFFKALRETRRDRRSLAVMFGIPLLLYPLMTLGMATYQPGWNWSEHIGAQSGKKWCSTEHVGVVLKGVAAVSFPDGTVREMRKGDDFYITGEQDRWVIGEVP